MKMFAVHRQTNRTNNLFHCTILVSLKKAQAEWEQRILAEPF